MYLTAWHGRGMLVNPCCTEERGEHRRYWIGGRDARIHMDVGVAVRLQIVVPVWVCQLNLSRLDGHRRPAQHDTFDFDQCP